VNLNGFLEELRRRRVFRTAAAYLAGAFVVLQAADLTFEPLGFSPTAYRILLIAAGIGFPVAVLLSWFLDLHGTRVQPTTEADHVDIAPRTTARGTTIAGFALLVVAFAAVTWYAVGELRSVSDDRRAAIAVMPFDVIGDPQLAYLETGIVEMVSRNIDGAANLRAVSPEMVISSAKDGDNDAASAAEIAKQLDARYVVSGNIARAGPQLRVTITVQDFLRAAAKPVTRVVNGSPDDLFDVVDRVSAQVLAATRSGEDAELSSSAAQTTRSLPALRAYLEGEDFYRRVRYDSAVAHFAQAVALDSTFALAYYRLGLAHLNHGTVAAARTPIDNAMRFGAGLPGRDRALIGTLADAMNGRWRQSIEASRSLLDRYPNDLELSYNLAIMMTLWNPRHGKPMAEAAPLFERVVAADPEFLCPI